MPLTSDSLTIPPAGSLNATGTGAAARQLAAAASRAVVPLVYGEDRISGLILNVLAAAGTPGMLLVQVLWCFACDSINDSRLNDQALPAGATITHYTGAQTVADATLVAAFAAQGITGVRPLTGYAWSLLAMPTALFDGQVNVTARIRGRRCYDPAFDSTASGVGPQRLADPSTWAYTDIPAVCLGDYLASSVYGCGRTVNWDSVRITSAANRVIVPGSSEQRRVVGVSFTSAMPASDVAETLRAYAGCFLLPSTAGVRLLPDQDDASMATYSHSAGDIAAIDSLDLRDLNQAPTAVEIIYTDTSAIPWRDASAIAQLEGAGTTKPWRLSQVRLPGVHRYGQAMREATERLNKLVLNDITTSLDVFDIGIKHDTGDIVTVDHPLGLSMTPMRVTSVAMPSAGRWRLGMVRHSSAAYSDIIASAAAIQDALRIVPAPVGLGIKLNVGDFSGTINYSEAYIHAVDGAGNALDAPGFILVNGVATAVPNGNLYTNQGPVAGYIVWDAAGATFNTGPGLRPYVLARRYQGAWQYDDNGLAGSTGWTAFTPAATHFIIGTLESGGPDTGNPGSAPGLIAASIWAAASTLNSSEANADAAYAQAVAAATVSLVADGAMTIVGNTAQKTGGGAGWTAAVHSRDSFTGGAYVSWVNPDPANYSFGLGLNEDPETNASYDSVTAWLYNAGTTLRVFNNGTFVAGFANAVAAGDVQAVTYDGATLRYFRNGTQLYSQAMVITGPLFLDSSFDTVGGKATNIQFGPLTSIGPALDYALAKANLAEVTAKAYADGIVSTEEARAIADAQAKADAAQAAAIAAAQSDATAKAAAAQSAAQAYALAQANAAAVTAAAYADGAVSAEEARAIADATAKANAARAAAESTAAADATAKADVAALTAQWSGVSGASKPADNATRNQVFFQDGDPVTSPGGVVDGAIWISSTKARQRVSGSWQPYVGAGSVDTNELADQAATVVAVFSGTGVSYSNIS